jgi:hypothetical protein
MNPMRRLLLLSGIASPLAYAAADAIAGSRWTAYSFRDQTISELGAIGAPSRPLFSMLVILAYLLLVAFGLGIWHAAEGRRRVRVVGVLITGLGLLALTAGQFVPMRARGTPQGLTGTLHLVEGAVAMLLLFTAMAFALKAFGRRFRVYTVVTSALMLAFGAWSGMDAPRIEAGLPTPWVGVRERIFWYAYQVWFVVLAVVMLRRGAERTEAH